MDKDNTTQKPNTIINLQKNSIITFGAYEWIVLEVQNEKALILSKDIIEKKRYNEKREDITYEKSSLRAYLNNEFYDLLTLLDRSRVLPSTNNNDNN